MTVTVTPKIYWGLNKTLNTLNQVNATSSGPREAGKLEVLRVVV